MDRAPADRKKQAGSGINRRRGRLMVLSSGDTDAGGDLDLRFDW
jgi:hypothetical protein